MSIYSGFGWSFRRNNSPPRSYYADTEGSESDPYNQQEQEPTQAQDTTLESNDKYFIIESRFNIVVVRIVVLSLKVSGVSAVLWAMLSLVYSVLTKLVFVANNVAFELLDFCRSFIVIVVVLFVVFIIGRFTLQYFLD